MNAFIRGNLASRTSKTALAIMILGALEQSGVLTLIPDRYEGLAVSILGALMLVLRQVTGKPIAERATHL